MQPKFFPLHRRGCLPVYQNDSHPTGTWNSQCPQPGDKVPQQHLHTPWHQNANRPQKLPWTSLAHSSNRGGAQFGFPQLHTHHLTNPASKRGACSVRRVQARTLGWSTPACISAHQCSYFSSDHTDQCPGCFQWGFNLPRGKKTLEQGSYLCIKP